AGKTVRVEVSYPMEAWGENPYAVFGYVLETGAGWYGTIGSADLIVRLPYKANEQNVLVSESPGFGGTSPGMAFAGSELRWRFTELEPEREDNLTVTMISPAVWKKILVVREVVRRNPQDGEAWGRLGKACKEAILERKGFLRQDPGGWALFAEGAAAYEKSVSLLPDDALWHFGFAELLWREYLSRDYRTYAHDQSLLVQAVRELKASLDLDPGSERALELAQEIAWLHDGIITFGHPIEYPILRATLVYPTEYPTLVIREESATATALPAATAIPLVIEPTPTQPAAAQAAPVEPERPAPESEPQKPGISVNLCGAIFLPLLGIAVVWKSRSRIQ
ncbi:MAG TPA: hypothetical protein VFF68_01125, partial [Anaerolineaceae bacterium]|nr:hypothetical protein [Anaerolineaceae bacterium]